jgi:LCP family protein required for cell wall assembly
LALLFAVPPLLLIATGLVLVVQSPELFALRLLAPTFGQIVLAFIGIHATWRVVAVVDAWRKTRSRPWKTDGSLILVAIVSLAVLGSHGFVAQYVYAINEAGSTIFTGDASDVDDLLGSGPGSSGGAGGVSGGNEGDSGDAGEDSGEDPGESEDDYDDPDDWTGGDPGPGTASAGPPSGNPPSALPRNQPVSILIIGTDAAPSRSHSLTDSLIVVTYFPERNQVSMISFPRDTGRLPMYDGRVFGPRINTMLGRAQRDPVRFPDGGIGTLVSEMQYLVGVPIQYWAITNMHGFRDLVDVVGGVHVRIDKAIADASKPLFLDPGTYHMNGDEVMDVVRSRRGPGNSDWERARRQQQVLRAIASRIKDPSVVARLPQVLAAASNLVRTNMPPDQLAELLALADQAEHATTHNVVLKPHKYAVRISPDEINGRYMTELRMDALAGLSVDLFGAHSRYSGSQP